MGTYHDEAIVLSLAKMVGRCSHPETGGLEDSAGKGDGQKLCAVPYDVPSATHSHKYSQCTRHGGNAKLL